MKRTKQQIKMILSIETTLLSYLVLVAGTALCSGQTTQYTPEHTDQRGVIVHLDDGPTVDAEIIRLDDAPAYNLNDESAERLPPTTEIHQLPVEYHFSEPTHFTDNGRPVEQHGQEIIDGQGVHFLIEHGVAFPSENYLHLLYPPYDPIAPEVGRKVATQESSYERALSHLRAGSPKIISERASLTYDDRYTNYYVGGGVPTGRRNNFGEDRAINEGTLGTDYAPWYSRVALKWSHGRLYQGGIGQYEPDHKNRPFAGQTLGRFFSKRERRHAEASHESHHQHSEGESVEPLFESEVTDADSSKR